MSRDITVSICCITYNHKDYIRQALDSFLMQKTNFKFEVLIHDDASTDGTAEIIREYEEKYPDIIKPVYQKENQYSKGVRGMTVKYNLPRALGKYIALCEGDDYWTDESKLQKQVDFLETNSDYALVFHSVEEFYENADQQPRLSPNPDEFKATRDVTLLELLKENVIPTNSVMYKKQPYDSMRGDIVPGDWYLHVYHAQFGKIKFFGKVMAKNRRHSGGVWWMAHKDMDKIWSMYGLQWVNLYEVMLEYFGDQPKYRSVILENLFNIHYELWRIDKKKSTHLLESSLDAHPKSVVELVRVGMKRAEERHTALARCEQLDADNAALRSTVEQLEDTLQRIQNTKAYKVDATLRRILGKK